MKPFIEEAQTYASYHQNVITQYTHLAGIPLIVFSLMIFLGFVQIIIPGVLATSLASFATLVLLIYYFRLNWQLALALTPIMIFLLWLASWFSYLGPNKVGLWVFAITFILGCAFQLYGYIVEDKKLSFRDTIYQTLIAPLYLTAELFFLGGYMKDLQAQIHNVEPAVLTKD